MDDASQQEPPGESAVFVRFGTAYEDAPTLESLSHDALLSELGVHGVSVFLVEGPLRTPGSVAAPEELRRYFNATKTGTHRAHYTVELPHPVTIDDAATFNRVFGRQQ